MPLMTSGENKDVPLALRSQIALFTLIYRYLTCLLSLGVLTIILLVAALLYAAIQITATMFLE